MLNSDPKLAREHLQKTVVCSSVDSTSVFGVQFDARVQACFMASPQYDRELKLVVVGDSGTGKTSIRRVFTVSEFSELYTPTTG